MAPIKNWNPFSTVSWARALGLAHVPLFGASRPNQADGDLAVLLDGRRSSLGLYATDDSEQLLYSPEPLSWSWSANLRHSLIVGRRGVLSRRWDAPDDVTRFPLPESPSDAVRIFGRMENVRAERSKDVITRLLTAFRRVRNTLAPYTTDPVFAIRVFNAFLVGTESVRFNRIAGQVWLKCGTVGEALQAVAEVKIPGYYGGFGDIPAPVWSLPIGDLLATFVDPDPHTKCQLEPDLLIRHASGVLYQEAHFELQRMDQFSFPGMASAAAAVNTPDVIRDARFTPPPLARAMVQQALDAFGTNSKAREALILLDPACGSGIFLQHAIQELAGIDGPSSLTVVGYDTSPVSCEISRFCLARAAHDVPQRMTVEIIVQCADALRIEWPQSHLILTNPPFAAWTKMSRSERGAVRDVLGPLFKGHADKAMAFVWKALQYLQPGGVLASIVPSPFLESNGGEKWREAILERASIKLIGRFSGFSFFQNAMVEPAFFVLRRRAAIDDLSMPVRILWAQENGEEEALRALRRVSKNESLDEELDSYSLFTAPAELITAASWLPRSKRTAELVERLTRSGMPTIQELFEVNQGVLTGKNSVFILNSEEILSLPRAEWQFFRLAAGSQTIRGGQLLENQYVFYPYDNEHVMLPTFQDLIARVPTYYNRKLALAKPVLSQRSGIDPQQWWLLTRDRREWQRLPKIVTAYFGSPGSFSYDVNGRFAVVQGYGWLWRENKENAGRSDYYDDEEEDFDVSFDESGLPWAYVALLNSSVFEVLLSHYCPRVQGGQFNLSDRFVKRANLPNLGDDNAVVADDVKELESFGRALVINDPVNLQRLNVVAARAYGIPLPEWGLDERRV